MNTSSLPPYPQSYWIASAPPPRYPRLERDVETDVAVVGGGLAGITTAYLLAREGMRVALVEAGELMGGTTGHTTAKITAQHDLIYAELIRNAGEEKAKLYYEANREAADWIRALAAEQDIDCDWTEQDAYLYTASEAELPKLDDEVQAYLKLGIPCEYVLSTPLPVPVRAAIRMPGQAQFHPLRYLQALLRDFTERGGEVYERTMVRRVTPGERPTVETRDGRRIRCGSVVSATHYPVMDVKGLFFARLYASRSYVLALRWDEERHGEPPAGMHLSVEEPKRSVRAVRTAGGDRLLLVGGEGHKTGQGICTFAYYEALETFARQTFGEREIAYRWSAQDLETLDKMPYIGRLSPGADNVYVATGFRKWGMTNGTAAALLLRDLIVGRRSPYRELFDPSRFDPAPGIRNAVTLNLDTAKHLIAGKFDLVRRTPEDVQPGEGAVVQVRGKRAGAYRDAQGRLHLVDTTCTHMGCELEWNAGETSWDCPCHGSRFTYEGEIMEGPAKRPLPRLSLTEESAETPIV